MGLPFQRVSLAQLWINSEFHGVYLLEEEIEKQWVKSHFGNVDDLVLLKNHRAQLVPENNYSVNYEVKMGDEGHAYDLLASLILTANNDFVHVWQKMRIGKFMRYMVIEWLIGNPDSYSWRGNNWWLLFGDELANYIPYDQEESFGLGMYISNWANMSANVFFNCQNLKHVDCSSPHPLSQQLLIRNSSDFFSLASRFSAPLTASLSAVKHWADCIFFLLSSDKWYPLDFDGPLRNSQTFRSIDVSDLLQYIVVRSQHLSS